MEYGLTSTLHHLGKVGVDSTRFCNLGANDSFVTFNGTCDIFGYGESLAYIGAPGIVLGALCLIAAIVLIFALCCNCCACCKTPLSKLFLGIFVLGALALGIAGLVITLTGNTGVDNGVTGLSQTIENTGFDLIDRIDTIATLLATVNSTDTSSFQSGLASARQVVEDMNIQINATRSEYIDPYARGRSVAVFIGCIVPPCIIAIGLLFVLCETNGCIGFTSWLLMFLVVVVWASLAIHLVANEVILDVCTEIDTVSADPSLSGDSPLTLLVSCTANSSALNGLQQQIVDIKTEVVDTACNRTNDLCTQGVADCSNFTCSEASLPQVYQLLLNDTVFQCNDLTWRNRPGDCPTGANGNIDSQDVPLSQCGARCNNTELRDAAVDINARAHDLEQLLAALNQLIPLVSCEFISTAFDSLKTQLCVNFTDSVKSIYSGNALQAAGMVFASILFLIACLALKAQENKSNKAAGRNTDL